MRTDTRIAVMGGAIVAGIVAITTVAPASGHVLAAITGSDCHYVNAIVKTIEPDSDNRLYVSYQTTDGWRRGNHYPDYWVKAMVYKGERVSVQRCADLIGYGYGDMEVGWNWK